MMRKVLGTLALIAGFCFGPVTPAPAQIQWQYSFQPNNQALATYLGDVTVNGVLNLNGGCPLCGAVFLNVPQTWTATQTFNGGASSLGIVAPNFGEPTTVTAGVPASTQNFDILTQSAMLFTANATANWTLNIRGNGSNTLNSVMAVNQSVTFVLSATQGASAFYNNAVTIDGTGVTPKWQGGAPVAGNASGIDVYTYTVIKTAASTYTVLASQTQFK